MQNVSVTQSLVKMGYTQQSHCILYNKEGIQKLKLVDKSVNVVPFDDFLSGLRNAHPRQDVNEMHDVEPLLVYQSYSKLSWMRVAKEDVPNDKLSKNDDEVLEIHELDPYDYKNFYRFPNELNYSLARVREQVLIANRRMWKFQLSTVEDGGLQSYSKWTMAIDERKKLVVISGATSLEIYRDEPVVIESPSSNTYIFPSYLQFKCESARVFYACGNTFV